MQGTGRRVCVVMDVRRVTPLALAAVAALAVACSKSTATSSSTGSTATGPRSTAAAPPPWRSILFDRRPLDLRAPLAGAEPGQARILQRARRAATGARVALLPVPGFGTLHVVCGASPSTSFVLTAWARGEGPPRVQHVHARLATPVGPPPLNALHSPVFAPARGTGPEAFDQWSVAIATEAFSGTATVWSAALPVRGGCELLGQALVVTHGAFWRYAPSHG